MLWLTQVKTCFLVDYDLPNFEPTFKHPSSKNTLSLCVWNVIDHMKIDRNIRDYFKQLKLHFYIFRHEQTRELKHLRNGIVWWCNSLATETLKINIFIYFVRSIDKYRFWMQSLIAIQSSLTESTPKHNFFHKLEIYNRGGFLTFREHNETTYKYLIIEKVSFLFYLTSFYNPKWPKTVVFCFSSKAPYSSLSFALEPWKWVVQYAPPPQDIYWENITVGHGHYIAKLFFVNLLIFLLLVFNFHFDNF